MLNRHLVQTAQVGTDIVMAHRHGLMVLADSDTAMVHRHALMEPVGLDTVTVHLRDLMVLVDLETVMALHPVLMAQVGCGTAMVHLLDLMVLAALGTVIKRHSIPRLLMCNRPVTGRSSKCPFEGQRENCLLLKCRDKRHLDIQVADKVTQPTRHRYLISTVQ